MQDSVVWVAICDVCWWPHVINMYMQQVCRCGLYCSFKLLRENADDRWHGNTEMASKLSTVSAIISGHVADAPSSSHDS